MIESIDHNQPDYFYMNRYETGLPSKIRTCDLRPTWAFQKMNEFGQNFANAACPARIFCLARSALTAA